MLSIFWLIFSYILGSVPFGLLVAKFMCGVDPRQDGSRNIGATNIARLCGARYGVLVLVLDALKGFTPVIVALKLGDSHFFHGLALMAPIVGHMFPIFLKGHGGKGVATTIGAFLALSPGALLPALALCAVVIGISGYVSLGSLTLITAVPLFLLLSGDFLYFLFGLAVMSLVFAKHRENIARLARGEEKTWKNGRAGTEPPASA